MIAGGDYLPLIPVQQPRRQLHVAGQADKAAIHTALADPVFNFTVIALHQLKFNVGIQLVEGFQNIRHPLYRYAGKGTHAHQTDLQTLQVVCFFLQLVLHGAKLLEIGQQGPPVSGQADAAAAACHQLQTQFVLQRCNGVADARLGKPKLLRRLGKAAAYGCADKDLILCDAHKITSASIVSHRCILCKQFFIIWMKNMRFTNVLYCAKINITRSDQKFYREERRL